MSNKRGRPKLPDGKKKVRISVRLYQDKIDMLRHVAKCTNKTFNQVVEEFMFR